MSKQKNWREEFRRRYRIPPGDAAWRYVERYRDGFADGYLAADQAELATLRREREALREALALAKSMILSGERMSEDAGARIQAALLFDPLTAPRERR